LTSSVFFLSDSSLFGSVLILAGVVGVHSRAKPNRARVAWNACKSECQLIIR
jgi:hypothetical protein